MKNIIVEIDTGRETVNAVEGVLVVPEGISIGDIYTGNSAVLIWVTKPSREGNTISFAGITPGGFRGEYPLFSLNASDTVGFSFSNIKAYKSDGSGESVRVLLSLREREIAEDTAPPEPFTPIISSSPDLFGGNQFVSFAAQDKGMGVRHFEAASTWLLSPGEDDWKLTESPLPLSRERLFQNIYIRATDSAGNMRVVSTPGPYHYYLLIFWVIILLCALLFLRRSFRQHS